MAHTVWPRAAAQELMYDATPAELKLRCDCSFHPQGGVEFRAEQEFIRAGRMVVTAKLHVHLQLQRPGGR
jgi:hypothetical protein